MQAAAGTSDHITAFERAVCYYTIPRLVSPVSLGLIVAYAICVVEAVVVLTIGIATDSSTWTLAGAYALAGIVTFGIVVFFFRALIAHVRSQRVLQLAQAVPDAQSQGSDLPDPFAGHVLLKCPRHGNSHTLEIRHEDGTPAYRVERTPGERHWRVQDASGAEYCTVQLVSRGMSFTLGEDTPARLDVMKEEQVVARIQRRLTLPDLSTEITPLNGRPAVRISRRGIYQGDRLAGRIYYLRECLYLDVEEQLLDEGLLGYFAALSPA